MSWWSAVLQCLVPAADGGPAPSQGTGSTSAGSQGHFEQHTPRGQSDLSPRGAISDPLVHTPLPPAPSAPQEAAAAAGAPSGSPTGTQPAVYPTEGTAATGVAHVTPATGLHATDQASPSAQPLRDSLKSAQQDAAAPASPSTGDPADHTATGRTVQRDPSLASAEITYAVLNTARAEAPVATGGGNDAGRGGGDSHPELRQLRPPLGSNSITASPAGFAVSINPPASHLDAAVAAASPTGSMQLSSPPPHPSSSSSSIVHQDPGLGGIQFTFSVPMGGGGGGGGAGGGGGGGPMCSLADAAALAVATVARVNALPSRSFNANRRNTAAGGGGTSSGLAADAIAVGTAAAVGPLSVSRPPSSTPNVFSTESSTVSISDSDENDDGLPSPNDSFLPSGWSQLQGGSPRYAGAGGGPGSGAGGGWSGRPASRSLQRQNAEEAAFIRGTLAALKQATLAGFEDTGEGEVLPGLPRVWSSQTSNKGSAAAHGRAGLGGSAALSVGAAAAAGGASGDGGRASHMGNGAVTPLSMNPVVHESNLAALFSSGFGANIPVYGYPVPQPAAYPGHSASWFAAAAAAGQASGQSPANGGGGDAAGGQVPPPPATVEALLALPGAPPPILVSRSGMHTLPSMTWLSADAATSAGKALRPQGPAGGSGGLPQTSLLGPSLSGAGMPHPGAAAPYGAPLLPTGGTHSLTGTWPGVPYQGSRRLGPPPSPAAPRGQLPPRPHYVHVLQAVFAPAMADSGKVPNRELGSAPCGQDRASLECPDTHPALQHRRQQQPPPEQQQEQQGDAGAAARPDEVGAGAPTRGMPEPSVAAAGVPEGPSSRDGPAQSLGDASPDAMSDAAVTGRALTGRASAEGTLPSANRAHLEARGAAETTGRAGTSPVHASSGSGGDNGSRGPYGIYNSGICNSSGFSAVSVGSGGQHPPPVDQASAASPQADGFTWLHGGGGRAAPAQAAAESISPAGVAASAGADVPGVAPAAAAGPLVAATGVVDVCRRPARQVSGAGCGSGSKVPSGGDDNEQPLSAGLSFCLPLEAAGVGMGVEAGARGEAAGADAAAGGGGAAVVDFPQPHMEPEQREVLRQLVQEKWSPFSFPTLAAPAPSVPAAAHVTYPAVQPPPPPAAAAALLAPGPFASPPPPPLAVPWPVGDPTAPDAAAQGKVASSSGAAGMALIAGATTSASAAEVAAAITAPQVPPEPEAAPGTEPTAAAARPTSSNPSPPQIFGGDLSYVRSLVERKWSPFFDLEATLAPPAARGPPAPTSFGVPLPAPFGGPPTPGHSVPPGPSPFGALSPSPFAVLTSTQPGSTASAPWGAAQAPPAPAPAPTSPAPFDQDALLRQLPPYPHQAIPYPPPSRPHLHWPPPPYQDGPLQQLAPYPQEAMQLNPQPPQQLGPSLEPPLPPPGATVTATAAAELPGPYQNASVLPLGNPSPLQPALAPPHGVAAPVAVRPPWAVADADPRYPAPLTHGSVVSPHPPRPTLYALAPDPQEPPDVSETRPGWDVSPFVGRPPPTLGRQGGSAHVLSEAHPTAQGEASRGVLPPNPPAATRPSSVPAQAPVQAAIAVTAMAATAAAAAFSGEAPVLAMTHGSDGSRLPPSRLALLPAALGFNPNSPPSSSSGHGVGEHLSCFCPATIPEEPTALCSFSEGLLEVGLEEGEGGKPGEGDDGGRRGDGEEGALGGVGGAPAVVEAGGRSDG